MSSNEEYYSACALKCDFRYQSSNKCYYTTGTLNFCGDDWKFKLVMKLTHSNQYDGYSHYKCYYRATFTLNFIDNFTIPDKDLQLVIIFPENPNMGFVIKLKLNDTNQFMSEKNEIHCSMQLILSNSDSNIINVIIQRLTHEIPLKANANKCLKENMQRLLTDTDYSDLKIEVDNTIFHVHKNILSIRNIILAQMINIDMLEKKTNKIMFNGWNPLVVKELLKFIYTAECDEKKMTHELFKLAHYLDIGDVQTVCNTYLESNINLENLVETLELTNYSQYNLQNLKEKAQLFIEQNKTVLAKDKNYLKYLNEKINLETIAFILEFSDDYKIEELQFRAIQYTRCHHNEVLQISKCYELLKSRPLLTLKMLNYYSQNSVDK